MADEYISRKEAIEAIKRQKELDNSWITPESINYNGGYDAAIRIISQMPTLGRTYGKWERKKGYLVCSNCGMAIDTIGYTYEEQDEVFRYCSCCGFKNL